MRLVKNLAATLGLTLCFAGLIWLIGTGEKSSFNATMEAISPQMAARQTQIGPVTAQHSTCRYFLPGTADTLYGTLICPSCQKQAEDVRELYDITVEGRHCGQRGTAQLIFRLRS